MAVLAIEFCTMQLSAICLEIPTVNGGSTVVIVEAKVALARTCLFSYFNSGAFVGRD